MKIFWNKIKLAYLFDLRPFEILALYDGVVWTPQAETRCEFEPGKAQYSTPIFFINCYLKERIETQKLGKAQALGVLSAVALLALLSINAQPVSL